MLFAFSTRPDWNWAKTALEVRFSFGKERGLMVVPIETFRQLLGRRATLPQCERFYFTHAFTFERAGQVVYQQGGLDDDGTIVILRDDLPGF